MSGLFEVYDNEQVQLITRRQAAVTFVSLVAAIGLTALLIIVAREALLPFWIAATLTTGLWIAACGRFVRHFQCTNHIVWCVKISQAQVAGYDYARRQTNLYWTDVRQIELSSKGLRIRGTIDRHLEIPHLFPDFASLSHRIVEHAERHHIPILIDGRPLEDLDLETLYPFLSSSVSAR